MRRNGSSLVKGLVAFNVLASVAYSLAAFARTGPVERDTRGMADALRWKEPWVGALILAPAVLDAVRYYQPGREVGGVGLAGREGRDGAARHSLTGGAERTRSRSCGPSANVIVPSTTTLPSTRATPCRTPIRLRSRRTSASMSTTSPGCTGRR